MSTLGKILGHELKILFKIKYYIIRLELIIRQNNATGSKILTIRISCPYV
jgi:hypothetical protein